MSEMPSAIVDLDSIDEYPNIMVFSKPKAGKGHPYGTHILSPTGWLKIEDLQIGTEIVGSDGKSQFVTGVFDRGNLDAYRVTFHDGASVIVDKTHLWKVQDIGTHTDKICKTEWLMNRAVLQRYSIPLVEPVIHNRPTIIGGYLMGTLLANGHLKHSIAITTNDEEIMLKAMAENPELDIYEVDRPTGSARVWRFRDGIQILRQYNLEDRLSKEKFIPEDFFWSSISNRKALLAALLDCNGSLRNKKQAAYFTRSVELAEGVRRLVEGLGGTALIACSNGIDYTVTLTTTFNPFTLHRKSIQWKPSAHRVRRRIVDIEYVGKLDIRCISVSNEDKLYVTERHIVTHNTTWACSDDDILVLNCEDSGTISAKRSSTLGHNVKQWPIKKYTDFETAVDWLKTIAERGEKIPFKWVVLDTITTLQDRQLMRDVMDRMLEKKPTRNTVIPDKPEYLENQLLLVNKVKELNDLPCGIVILAHVMQQVDPEGQEFYYPQIQGGKYKVAQQILAMMTSFGYMYVKTRTKDGKPIIENGKVVKDRYIMWEDHKQMQGGDRTGTFGQFTKNITLKELRMRIEKGNSNANN